MKISFIGLGSMGLPMARARRAPPGSNGRLFRSPIYEDYGNLIAEERYEPAGFKLSTG